jgi:tetratricopeptide (TPR) repeat protein
LWQAIALDRRKDMRRSNTAAVLAVRLAKSTWQYLDSTTRSRRSTPKTLAALVLFACAALGAPVNPARQPVIKIVPQIQQADYEGDRAALKQLYGELTPFVEDKELASRVRYWRGFALWRRALNGANESVDSKELDADLKQAVNEFHEAAAKDAGFVDAKVATASCLLFRVFLNRGDAERVQELLPEALQLIKEAQTAAPENPRLLWVVGANYWYLPPERGGGDSKAMETYQKGLEASRNQKSVPSDPLDPTWGEPELLMNLSWSSLHLTNPDLNAAEQYASSALKLVPNWHYVRDILLPQIRGARSTAK